jgi:hypothetical protein
MPDPEIKKEIVMPYMGNRRNPGQFGGCCNLVMHVAVSRGAGIVAQDSRLEGDDQPDRAPEAQGQHALSPFTRATGFAVRLIL